jgi:predicted ATPase
MGECGDTLTEAADTGFKRIQLSDWRQFATLDISFHPQLTVLTGANASGKSTILSLLATHFNWSRVYSSAPIKRGKKHFWSNRGFSLFGSRREADEDPNRVGTLTYANGGEARMVVPENDESARAQYSVNFAEQQAVPGVFLTSHRAVSGNYAPVESIPTLFGTSDQLFEQFTNELRVRWQGSWTGKTPQLALKESLIAAAVFGEGSESVERNEDAWQIWVGFQQVLREIMPQSLGFRRLRVRVPEIIVEAESGDFIIDEASGGLSAIVEMAWQIFLRSRNQPRFTVLIDEPENHLHPSLQREILPALLSAFPTVQFIVATHSPFVVTATPDSGVFVLDYDDDQRVTSRPLDYVNRSASADETLRRVLGVESTVPVWAEARFRSILDEYLTPNISAERMRALRIALEQNGLEAHFPDAVIAASDQEEATSDAESGQDR